MHLRVGPGPSLRTLGVGLALGLTVALASAGCDTDDSGVITDAEEGGEGYDEHGDDGDDDDGDDGDDDDDDDVGDDDDDDDDDAQDDDPADTADAVAAAHTLPSIVVGEGRDSATVAAEAVFMASQAAGGGVQIVTSGTLTQQGGAFAYSPTPADRLVVALTGGTDFEIWYGEIEGDPSSAAAFLGGDHRFSYRIRVGDDYDFELDSTRQGGGFSVRAQGSFAHEGARYEADVTAQGTYFSEVDSTGSHHRDEFATTGRITADGFDLDVDETWYFELVTSDAGSAQAAQRTVSSSLSLGDDVYDWVDAVTAKSFKDGLPSQLDTYWQARGEVLRNGEPYGQLRLDPSEIDFIKFMLDLPGESIELERHKTYG